MKLLTLLRGELTKMYRQRGTYAGYALLAVFSGLFVWGVYEEGLPMDPGDLGAGSDFAVGGNLISGPAIPYVLLDIIPVAVTVFIPLLVSMIAGGIIAAEAQRGTLRTMLTRPVHRWAVVIAKVLASFVHATSLVCFMGLFALAAGYLVFGRGDIVTVMHGFRIIPEPQALVCLAYAYGLTALTMCSVAAIAVFCSILFEHPLTASGVTVGFLIVSAALMVIPYFQWLSPYLLTSHFHGYREIFARTTNWRNVWVDMYYVGVYAAVAVAGTLVIFCRKDITC